MYWAPPYQSAIYCLQNDVNLEQGLEWVQASVLLKEVYWNTRVLAQLQQKLAMNNKAIATMEKAIALGGKMENAPFDFDRMKDMLTKWTAQ